MLTSRALATIAWVVGSMLPSVGLAQTYEGPRLLGFAEARRALAGANDAIYVNPAGIALAKLYSVEAGYFDDFLGSDRRFNASVVDSQAGPVAGGLAYTYSTRRPDDAAASVDQRLKGHRTELSLATRVAENAAIGATVRYLSFDRNEGDQDIPGGGFSAVQVDAGFQWRFTEGLSLGLVGYNLTNSERPEMPISWGAGLGFANNLFSLEADVRYNAQRGEPRYSFAGGIILFEVLALRGGTTFDYASKTWAISGGAGASLDRLIIDLGFRQRLGDEVLEGYGDERVFGLSARMVVF